MKTKTKEEYWIVEVFHSKNKKWSRLELNAYSIAGCAYMIRNIYREFGLKARMKKVKDPENVKLKKMLVYSKRK